MKRPVMKLCGHMFLCSTAAVPVGATAIDFEAQAAHTDGSLTDMPNLPLTIRPRASNAVWAYDEHI